MKTHKILIGDCRDQLKTLPDESIDSIVTDPPYELGFMGKGWDKSGIAYDQAVWRECLRVLKPGGHMLAFSGSRTYHRMTCAIEDSGFEIRDQIMWVYGSGFPKSHDVSKGIDKAAGLVRGRVVAQSMRQPIHGGGYVPGEALSPEALSPEAKEWQGWGTAMKPSHEPIVLARKPFSESTVAKNVLKHGTGGINIDGCRVGADGGGTHCTNRDEQGKCKGHKNAGRSTSGETFHGRDTAGGRWPANLIHDGSEEVVSCFPTDGKQSAARFFYCPKASKADRENSETTKGGDTPCAGAARNGGRRNNHPTVKPTQLMRYLCRLITPPGGTVLDPFTGSGSTGKAATLEGFRFIGCELSEEYAKIAEARIQNAAETKEKIEEEMKTKPQQGELL